jgi:hypothetical protein
VDKSQFLNVVQHFSDSSVEEAQEILSLKESFPYSQLLHALSARVSRDHGFSTQQSELQLAAVYAGDRAVLKDVMTLAASDFVIAAPAQKGNGTHATPPPVTTTPTPVAVVTTATEEYEDVADELIHDLDRLHELKHNFEMLFADGAATETVKKQEKAPEPRKEVIVVVPVHEVPKKVEVVEPEVKETGKTRKQRIIEMAKAVAAAKETNPSPEAKAPIKPKKRKEANDSLIEEIQSTKEELAPSDEKLKHQIEVIDQFIKTQPSITNVKDKLATAPVGDLSSIKSGEFSDHIVSETLVEILLQQGKKDKAIEVLKKLIWKFPQKKAYFAAQIEELKK